MRCRESVPIWTILHQGKFVRGGGTVSTIFLIDVIALGVPGFQRSKETLSNISIELSRREIAVIAIDPYAQGDSSSSMSTRAATDEGYGMFAVVPMMFILPYFNRSFFLLTGNIYLGAVTTCLIFIMMLISNTVCYIPL
jgi:glycopeptide antibiotics resistance protein